MDITEQRNIIENFVNSQEAASVVEDHWDWDGLMKLLNPLLLEPLTEGEEQSLHDDLRDWWKNGNFIPDEQFPWELGEWPWWTE